MECSDAEAQGRFFSPGICPGKAPTEGSNLQNLQREAHHHKSKALSASHPSHSPLPVQQLWTASEVGAHLVYGGKKNRRESNGASVFVVKTDRTDLESTFSPPKTPNCSFHRKHPLLPQTDLGWDPWRVPQAPEEPEEEERGEEEEEERGAEEGGAPRRERGARGEAPRSRGAPRRRRRGERRRREERGGDAGTLHKRLQHKRGQEVPRSPRRGG